MEEQKSGEPVMEALPVHLKEKYAELLSCPAFKTAVEDIVVKTVARQVASRSGPIGRAL